MARQSRAIPVLLTRPAVQGDRFAQDLDARFGGGVRVVVSPLLTPGYLSPTLPTGMAGLILTSETAVQAIELLPGRDALPRQAWCVGNRTSAAAREAGFETRSADGDAGALVQAILDDGDPGPLLHLRGQEVRGDVRKRLNSAGIETHEAIVYAQIPNPLSASAMALLNGPGPVIVPLFSPRTATLFAAAAQGATAPLYLAAFSPAVAEPVAGLPAVHRVCATAAQAPAMLDAIEDLLRHTQSS